MHRRAFAFSLLQLSGFSILARRKQLHIGAPGEDRFPYVPDLNGPDHMRVIAEELARRGQPSSTIEKVLGANFQRALADIWGTA